MLLLENEQLRMRLHEQVSIRLSFTRQETLALKHQKEACILAQFLEECHSKIRSLKADFVASRMDNAAEFINSHSEFEIEQRLSALHLSLNSFDKLFAEKVLPQFLTKPKQILLAEHEKEFEPSSLRRSANLESAIHRARYAPSPLSARDLNVPSSSRSIDLQKLLAENENLREEVQELRKDRHAMLQSHWQKNSDGTF